MPCSINERLPVELLTDILLKWSQVDEDGVWMASAVCHHWRRIVISCPQAWATIWVTFKPRLSQVPEGWSAEEDDLGTPRGKQRPILLWIERSKQLPLTVRIDAHTLAPDLEARWVIALPPIMIHSSRIRELDFDVNSTLLAEVALHLVSHQLASLQRLIFNVREAMTVDPPPTRPPEVQTFTSLWKSLGSSHNLKTIVARGCSVAPSTDPFLNPKQLTTLELEHVKMDDQDIMVLPYRCKNLTTLHLGTFEAMYRPYCSPSAPRISLPHLRTLSLSEINAPTAAHVLRDLSTPNLSQLTLSGPGLTEWQDRISAGAKTYDLYSDMGTAFESFVQRSPKIQTLHLAETLLPDRYLIRVLQHLDDLRELCFNRTFIGPPGLRALAKAKAPPADKKFLCPRIRHLGFVSCDLVTAEDFATLFRVRSSHRNGSAPIERLTIKYCECIAEKHLESLKEVTSSRIIVHFSPP